MTKTYRRNSQLAAVVLMVCILLGYLILCPFSAKAEGLMTAVEFAALVNDAMQKKTGVRHVALEEGGYYMAGVPMEDLPKAEEKGGEQA